MSKRHFRGYEAPTVSNERTNHDREIELHFRKFKDDGGEDVLVVHIDVWELFTLIEGGKQLLERRADMAKSMVIDLG